MSNLLQEMGNLTLDGMKDSAKAVLLQQLGVDQWMSDTPCSITDNLYTPSVNGWNNGRELNQREREREFTCIIWCLYRKRLGNRDSWGINKMLIFIKVLK